MLGTRSSERRDHSPPEPETGSLAYSPPTPPLIGRLRVGSSTQAQLEVGRGPASGEGAAEGRDFVKRVSLASTLFFPR